MTIDLQSNRAFGGRSIVPVLAFACLCGWGAHSAQAGSGCGDTIEPGGSVTLDADIGPCDDDGGTVTSALTIRGPVKVDFNGHKVICSAKITGIEVIGHNAKIKDGIVTNCEDAIRLSNNEDPDDDEVFGRHKIFRMIVRSNQSEIGNRGFHVESDRNYLALDLALRFNGEGYRIEGNENRLVRDNAVGNQNHGFRVDGNENTLTRNLALRVGSEEDGGEGFRVDGMGNRLFDNSALKSQDEGYRIREDGQDNTLLHNLARGNGASDGEAGIRVQGSGNRLSKNIVVVNAGDGILVEDGAGSNRIDRNTARGNGGTDLVDENMDQPCDDNDWKRNRFGTASPDCIQ